MDIQKLNFLNKAVQAATEAGHIFPTMAAAEAALESSYGTSALAIKDFNLFGMKQHTHPIYGTHVLPTREFMDGVWMTVDANWITYPNWRACFVDRMNTLMRLAHAYPHYHDALVAADPIAYVRAVSQSWSTDPARATKVIEIYNDFVPVPPCHNN